MTKALVHEALVLTALSLFVGMIFVWGAILS